MPQIDFRLEWLRRFDAIRCFGGITSLQPKIQAVASLARGIARGTGGSMPLPGLVTSTVEGYDRAVVKCPLGGRRLKKHNQANGTVRTIKGYKPAHSREGPTGNSFFLLVEGEPPTVPAGLLATGHLASVVLDARVDGTLAGCPVEWAP